MPRYRPRLAKRRNNPYPYDPKGARERRKYLRLGVGEYSRLLGVSSSLVSKWEMGKRGPGYHMLRMAWRGPLEQAREALLLLGACYPS